MRPAERFTLASVVAALAAGLPLVALTQDRSYLLLAMVLMLASAILGTLLRRAGRGEALVRLAQLTPALLMPWLVPETIDPIRLYSDAAAFVYAAFAPMPYQVGFAVFCAALVWLCYLLLETLAIGLHSPAWTFPVLVMPYLVVAVAIYPEASPFLFGFVAIGYALILAVSVHNRARAEGGGQPGMVALAATASTVLALVAMLLISLPLPERTQEGRLAGGGAVQLGDPSLDLIRNINSISDQPLIHYRSSDQRGSYLRLAALTTFDERGFHMSPTELVPLQLNVDPPGRIPTESVRTSIEVGAFASEYLPVPWLPTAATVAGEWRYDPRTLAVVAVGPQRNSATRDLSYEVLSQRLPSVESLLPELTDAGQPGDRGLSLALPDALSSEVFRLADEVAATAPTAGEKALAIRNFLRSEFTYSTAVAPGTTMETLHDFLLGSRTGYCEQFAGAMAVLARAQGIPSRVVVGFLPGRQVDGGWEVTARNMHAWAELYFGPGVGWVPFDATPAGVGNPNVDPTASPSPTVATPTTTPSTETSTPTTQEPSDLPNDGFAGAAGPWAGPLAGLVLLVIAATGPRAVRRALRWRRLSSAGGPGAALEGAWAEICAQVRDRGGEWPAGSTRQVAQSLGAELDPSGHAALAELAVLVEQARYSDRSPQPVPQLADLVGDIERAIERRWASPTAWVWMWWPRSLWPRLGDRAQWPSS